VRAERQKSGIEERQKTSLPYNIYRTKTRYKPDEVKSHKCQRNNNLLGIALGTKKENQKEQVIRDGFFNNGITCYLLS
jgi:hypothetical protein